MIIICNVKKKLNKKRVENFNKNSNEKTLTKKLNENSNENSNGNCNKHSKQKLKQENVIKSTLKLHNCHLSKLKPPDQTSCNLLLLRDLLGAQFSHCATFFPGISDTMGLNIIWSHYCISHKIFSRIPLFQIYIELKTCFHEFYEYESTIFFHQYFSVEKENEFLIGPKKALFFSIEHLKKIKTNIMYALFGGKNL